MSLETRNRSLIGSRYSRLAALESIGGNAGAMSRAVNGAADVETGEVLELGNFQNLSAPTRACLASGRAALFTIREQIAFARAAFAPAGFTLFAGSAFGARARQALEEVVAWMAGQGRVW